MKKIRGHREQKSAGTVKQIRGYCGKKRGYRWNGCGTQPRFQMRRCTSTPKGTCYILGQLYTKGVARSPSKMRRCSGNPHGTCSGILNSIQRVWHAALPKCDTVRAILTELALNLQQYMETNARDVQRASPWMRREVLTVTSPDQALPPAGSGASPLRKIWLLHHHPPPPANHKST